MSKQSLFYIIGAALCIAGLVLVLAFTSAGLNIIGGVLFLLGCVAGLIFTHAPTIARRELGGFFYSPIAYILMAAYLGVIAFIFCAGIQASGRAQTEQTFGIMMFLSLFICPVITMRLLAEEARLGTLETMTTAPITDFELTIGKFVGAFLFYLILNIPTLVFVLVLSLAGKPDYGTIIASYVGIVLFGAMLISVGLLVSAFTKNQVISAFVSFVATFLLYLVGIMGRNAPGIPGKVISYIGAATHYMDFTRGMIMSQHVLYYITLCVFFLFLTVRTVESHRWR